MVVILQMLLFLVCFLFPQLTFSWLNCWMFRFSLLSQQLTFFYGVHTVGVAVVLQMILLPRGESGCWDIARGRHSLCSHHHLHHLHHNHQYYRHYHSHDLLAKRESGAWDVARRRHSVLYDYHHRHYPHHLFVIVNIVIIIITEMISLMVRGVRCLLLPQVEL